MRDIIQNSKTCIDIPTNFHFEYDFHCNLKCPQCRRDFRHLSKEQVKTLNNVMDKNIIPLMATAKKLTLTGAGEALASPHSLHFLKQLSPDLCPDLEIKIMTNGATVNKEKWMSLRKGAELIKEVVVSIDGTNEIFEEIRHPAKWDNLVNSMEFFKEMKASSKLRRVSVTTVVQRKNFRTFDELYSYCIRWKVDILNLKRIRNSTQMEFREFSKIDVVNKSNPEYEEFMRTITKLRERYDHLLNQKKSLSKDGIKIELPQLAFADF
jgi:MoaA/NifB/PqqE/SkfB family radical SAM enzyme